MATKNDPDDLQTVTLKMPEWMLAELRSQAEARGITTTELLRRAVNLERLLFEDKDSVVTVRNERLGTERTVRML